MNYIPNDISPDAGTLFVSDGGSAFIHEGWGGGREGTRD